MIDGPPQPIAVQEQVIEQKLTGCGLKAGGFTVKYDEELQSIEIVIADKAGASADQFDCIEQATSHEIITFQDRKMQAAYDKRISDLMRPQILAEAHADLEKRGLLDGFPKRSDYSSDKLFAEALEQHCGMKPGSFFVESHGSLIAQPKVGKLSEADWDKMSCLMNSVMYASAKGANFKIGFIGNEAIAPKQ